MRMKQLGKDFWGFVLTLFAAMVSLLFLVVVITVILMLYKLGEDFWGFVLTVFAVMASLLFLVVVITVILKLYHER
jgi:hypothetical protein